MNSLFANLYEFLYYEPNFSTAIFSGGLYGFIGLSSIIVPIFLCLIYYKLIDRPSLATVLVWIVIGVLSSVFSFIASYTIIYNNLADLYDFSSSQYFRIASISSLLSIVLYALFSMVVKKISINTKNIPF